MTPKTENKIEQSQIAVVPNNELVVDILSGLLDFHQDSCEEIVCRVCGHKSDSAIDARDHWNHADEKHMDVYRELLQIDLNDKDDVENICEKYEIDFNVSWFWPKCPLCGEYYDEEHVGSEEINNGKHKGEWACTPCRDNVMQQGYHRVVNQFSQEGQEVVHFDSDFIWSEDGDFDTYPDWFDKIYKDTYIHRVDGWRAWEETRIRDNYVMLGDGWVTGYPDDTMQHKRELSDIFEDLAKAAKVIASSKASKAAKNKALKQLPPVPLYWLFAPTSNVFSTTCKVFCHKNSQFAIAAWLAARYGINTNKIDDALA